MNDVRAANGLGWFSVGLGLAQALAPDRLCRLTGVGDHPGLMRAMGVREILQGAVILAQRRPEAGLWALVAGDALDLTLLGSALRSRGAKGGRIAAAAAMVLGVAALDLLYARRIEG